MDASARQIRQRIVWTILRAFIGVVFLTILTIILVTGAAMSNNLDFPPFGRLPIVSRFEGYYIGHGSWGDVQSVLVPDPSSGSLTLLDAEKRILIDHGSSNSDRVGAIYQSMAPDLLVNLKANGETVGILVFDRDSMPSQLEVIRTVLTPVSLVSVFLALLATALVGGLSRRIVTPLAEVIAASRAVAAGKLDSRVQVQGPQDLLILTDSFNQMAAALERNDRQRRDLLADIAHELRTPLSAIRGRLEGMLDGVYPADEKHISLALKANYLLEHLVEDLRLLTLAESRQLVFEKKEIDLKTLAAHTIEMFSAEAQGKDIALELEPANGDYLILADPQRTEQVMGNLVGNALRYVPAGGRVWITLEKTNPVIAFSICDSGPGIPDEDLPYIFDRFWRKEKSRSRNTGGSGLGLAIAKQFVETQGGTIAAENLPGGGLKVKVVFPGG